MSLRKIEMLSGGQYNSNQHQSNINQTTKWLRSANVAYAIQQIRILPRDTQTVSSQSRVMESMSCASSAS
jgi:hypothetical protein